MVTAAEKRRLKKLLTFELEARSKGFVNIAGVDEAGRGPLAGPLYAAACVIPDGIIFPGIDDSKKLTAEARRDLYQKITNTQGVFFGVGTASPEKIDEINIYQATLLAMQEALSKLAIELHYILVDGLKLNFGTVPTLKIIGGDGKSQSIAAASIIAKVTRDKIMEEYHEQWPLYGFNAHKGYSTPQHLNAIAKYGPCPIHRMTFSPLLTFSMNTAGVP